MNGYPNSNHEPTNTNVYTNIEMIQQEQDISKDSQNQKEKENSTPTTDLVQEPPTKKIKLIPLKIGQEKQSKKKRPINSTLNLFDSSFSQVAEPDNIDDLEVDSDKQHQAKKKSKTAEKPHTDSPKWTELQLINLQPGIHVLHSESNIHLRSTAQAIDTISQDTLNPANNGEQ